MRVPAHKKGSRLDKCNYRPISLLPVVSKVFERLVSRQINSFMETRFSKYLCGFRKGYSTRHALLDMIRNWQKSLNSSGKVGALLMDLSKAFDCLPHDLLLAKLEAYGFGTSSLRYLQSYLGNRLHRVRIGSQLSDWLEILIGVPQGSVLGPILFNIFINDLFLVMSNSSICNFADDNTLYVCDTSLERVISRLTADTPDIVEWFSANALVANPDKFQLIYPGHNRTDLTLPIGNLNISACNTVKLLGVTIDNDLTFYPHIKDLCNKVSQKTRALMRIRSDLSHEKANSLFNAYILSHFNYCPLVWMYCDKKSHDLLANTHFRALKVKENLFSLTYSELLLKSNSKSIHERNLTFLVAEVYKSLHHLGPCISWDIFKPVIHPHDLRRGTSVNTSRPNKKIGVNSFDFRAGMAWNHIPGTVKQAPDLKSFLNDISRLQIYCKCTYCA